MKVDDRIKAVAKQIGFYAAAFGLGGVVAFIYSYVPLHNAKNWKIEYLEDRLASHASHTHELEEELGTLRAESAGKPDHETFKLLQNELDSGDKTIKDLESRLSRSERRLKELERSRNNWKAKHAKAEASLEALSSPAAANPQASSPGAESGAADALPAAPAQSRAGDEGDDDVAPGATP